jgi:spore germination protein GerM
MKKLLLAASIALFAAACSSTNAVHLISPDQLPPELYGKQPQAASSREQQAIVYFIRGNRLVQVQRTGPTSSTGAELVMRLLLQGPSPEEQADGMSTAIPPDTALLGVVVERQIATVNLSQEFERAAAAPVHEIRLAQIVYSLTELQEVDAVRFRIEGDPNPVIDQNGNPVRGAVARGSYSRFQPNSEASTPIDPCTLVESLSSCPQNTNAQ